MIFNNVELHNITELIDNENGSKGLCRFPESLRVQLNDIAKGNCKCTAGVEVRFVINSGKAVVKFDGPVIDAEIYYGSFQSGMVRSEDGTVTVEYPENIKELKEVSKKHNHPFCASVVRIILPFSAPMSIISAQGDIRVPKADEVPDKKLLIYGSSITHGYSAMHTAGSYAMRTAMLLGVDLINLGIAGGALMEDEMADYIAERDDFDYAVLEMGVNFWWDSAEKRFRSADEYAKRIDYFVERIAKAHSDKWIFVNSFYPCKEDFSDEKSVADEYREVLKKKVAKLDLPKLVYFDGSKFMQCGITGLSCDLIHPSAEGAINISNNLAKTIAEKIGK